MLISEAFEKYRQDVIEFGNQSRRTEEQHQACMKLLIAYLGDIDMQTLEFGHVRAWKEELSKTRESSSVRVYIIRLRVVLMFCLKAGIETLSADLVKVPKRVDKVPSFISREEVASMIDNCTRLRTKAIIAMLYAYGLRVSEICKLNRSDIHGMMYTIVGKGGSARLCFLDDRAKLLIEAYLSTRRDNHPALFISQTGARLSPTNVQLAVRIAAKNAGINKKVTPHTLRHTFATELLLQNTNLRHVQVMMGHKSIVTTQMYTHVVDRDLEQVYRKGHLV